MAFVRCGLISSCRHLEDAHDRLVVSCHPALGLSEYWLQHGPPDAQSVLDVAGFEHA
jgi:hypothetical protein